MNNIDNTHIDGNGTDVGVGGVLGEKSNKHNQPTNKPIE